ncbi:MAG TPA: glycosyl hydrolase [Casimicrobiaceae bacterium]|nr:glycosyl hydrolase [Casimicrobiaceae bacterium]
MSVVAIAIAWLLASTAILALTYRRTFLAAWREPVLSAPVLIVESDDWGYGPPGQARELDRIADVLADFRDAAGRHPVATLGVVLAGPDTLRMREEGCRSYRRLTLGDGPLAPVREAMLRGAARGVFALQLHAMEHFWPASLLRSAKDDVAVREWLTQPALASTEDLPSPLQSRWVDASVLPSRPLPEDEAVAAATDETRAFASLLGSAAEVVVPTTFVWNDAVEGAWLRAGVKVVVTPGVRNEARDTGGRIVAGERTYFNAQRGPNGGIYVVRDAYFEPSLGQDHGHALAALSARTLGGRPTLLEMHRMNFMGDPAATQHALDELSKLMKAALAAFPSLRFMSTVELAREYGGRSALVEKRAGTRLHYLIRRVAEVSRLRKLAWLTGAALPAWLAYVATRPAARRLAESAA